jgi:hypothetical protein
MAPRHLDPDRVRLSQVALELGLTKARAALALYRVRALYPRDPLDKTWDARVIDVVNALHGRPHRDLSPPARDWLSRYLEGRP